LQLRVLCLGFLQDGDVGVEVYVRKDLGGKPHIEAAGLPTNASERFLAAMEEMGYAPDSYKTLPQ
jgi:hypothetical protein